MSGISFDNTEIAFKSKSDKDLKKAYQLFKMVGKPWLVKLGNGFVKFLTRVGLLPKRLIKRTIFAQFCGGENIADCDSKIKELAEFNVGTILDYSVEGKTTQDDFDATCAEIIATIDKSNKEDSIPFSVFKVTGISRFGLLEKVNDPKAELTDAERREFAEVHTRVDSICRRAYETQTPVFIDAEDSWIQDAIDRLADAMMARYNKEIPIVFNTIQLYRHDRLDFLKSSHEKAKNGGYKLGLKLVRGAYMEKERERAEEKGYQDPINPDKKATDKCYDDALEYCIDNINGISICAGTHNENSSAYLCELMAKAGIDKGDKRVYFAQLLGMSDHISYNLSHAGYQVAKYVPYGPIKEVMPYLLRRAQENTSVAGQTSRELSLITREIKRRKKG